MSYPNKWLILLVLVTLNQDRGWMWLNCVFLTANRSMLREGFTLYFCCSRKLWETSVNYQCSSTNQILAKSLALSVSPKSGRDRNKIKLRWDSYPCPAVLCFSRRSLIKSSRHQRLNFPDPRTRRDIICHHPELGEDDPGRPLKSSTRTSFNT